MTGSPDSHLEAALREADDDRVRYHIREALQLRVAERESENGVVEQESENSHLSA